MKFGNPPVTEVWIDIEFSPIEDAEEIQPAFAAKFIEGCPNGFIPSEMADYHVHVKLHRNERGEIKAKGESQTFGRLRGKTSDGTRWLQVMRNRLVINQVRQHNVIPSYSANRAELQDYVTRYLTHFKPVHISRAWLNYQNLIVLPPFSPPAVCRPKDFFKLDLDIPENDFGAVSRYAFEAQWPEIPVEGGGAEQFDVMKVTFQTHRLIPYIAPPPSDGAESDDSGFDETTSAGEDAAGENAVGENQMQLQYLMTWNGICEGIGPADADAVFSRLDAVHRRLVDNFAACFTPAGLALFAPEETR